MEQRRRDEERDQDMAYLKTQMDLLIKHLLSEDEVIVDKPKESNPVESEKLDSSADDSEKENEKEEEVVLMTIPRPPPPFPQQLNKKVDDTKFEKGQQWAGGQSPPFNAVSIRFLVQKKAVPGAFTIPRKVGSLDVAKALCDLGANVNLMPLAVYKKLDLEALAHTNMRLVMVDRLIKWPIGILQDVLMKVAD
ncbi:uncharacterized protein LOC107865453 [Capsicum annuum]|uniref:uncharacterized protein LOC107865453 n=1 Tax=Capsicum annuum TaxID=4072 RepID=UPI001FB0A8DE|nr:uncharacterized protein LOC107865453 [Capsicum annuum]